jgi:hypothetical protein
VLIKRQKKEENFLNSRKKKFPKKEKRRKNSLVEKFFGISRFLFHLNKLKNQTRGKKKGAMSVLRNSILTALMFVTSLIRDWNKREINDAGLKNSFPSGSHPLVVAFLKKDENNEITEDIKYLLSKTESKRRSVFTTAGEFFWSPIFFACKGDSVPRNYLILTVLDPSLGNKANEAIVGLKSAFKDATSTIWVLKEDHTRLPEIGSLFEVYNSLSDILRDAGTL